MTFHKSCKAAQLKGYDSLAMVILSCDDVHMVICPCSCIGGKISNSKQL